MNVLVELIDYKSILLIVEKHIESRTPIRTVMWRSPFGVSNGLRADGDVRSTLHTTRRSILLLILMQGIIIS